MHVKIGFITPTMISLAHLLFPNAYQTTLYEKRISFSIRILCFSRQKAWANSDLKDRQICPEVHTRNIIIYYRFVI